MRLLLLIAVLVGSEASLFLDSSPANYTLLCDSLGPFRCHCPRDDSNNLVDCSKRNMTNMPSGIDFPEYVTEVTFTNNELSAIPNTVFYRGHKVDSLDFSHNRIRIVASDAFQGLDNLMNLDLSYNDIWSLSLDTFHGLSYLTTLNLAYNKLNNFFPDVFKGCDELQELILKHNQISFIERNSFSYLKGLKTLDLSSTGLADLPSGVFVNNTQLNSLDLSYNSFVFVPTEGILSAKLLRILNISENPIERVPAKAFSSSSVEVLRISHMAKLRSFEKYSLTGLSQLMDLQITDNLRLTKISAAAFKRFPKPKVEGEDESKESEEEEDSVQHPSLKKLSLRHNGLQYLPEDLLDWKQLTDLDLRENPWQCDCHLAWIANEEVSEAARKGAVCATPKRLAGRAQSSLVESDYTCHYLTAEATVALSVVVVAAFVLALVGIAFLMYKRSLIKCRCRRRDRTQPKYTRVVSTKDKVDLEWDHSGEPPSSTDA